MSRCLCRADLSFRLVMHPAALRGRGYGRGPLLEPEKVSCNETGQGERVPRTFFLSRTKERHVLGGQPSANDGLLPRPTCSRALSAT